MSKFKQTYLVDLAIKGGALRIKEYECQFDAERVANALADLFTPGEIELLQTRVRYDKIEDDVECTA